MLLSHGRDGSRIAVLDPGRGLSEDARWGCDFGPPAFRTVGLFVAYCRSVYGTLLQQPTLRISHP